jgi:hypothetical protein
MPISFPVISLSPDLEVNQFRQVGHGWIFLSRLGDVFRKAGFQRLQRAKATPFNLILEVKGGCMD